MSLSIYYQAILSSLRKALAFVIYGDSHLGSISSSHFVAAPLEGNIYTVAHFAKVRVKEVMCS